MEPERVGDIVGLTAHGQRGRPVDRHGAVRRARPPRAEPRRRHVLPLRLAGHPGRGRRRRRHHVQAALQRHRRDDRRAGPAGPDRRARDRAVAAAAEGVARDHHHDRRPGKWDDADFGRCPTAVEVWDRTPARRERRSSSPPSPASPCSIHDQRCAAELRRDRSRGIVARRRTSGSSSTSGSARAAATAATSSNCLSVQPIDTPYGRKTRIHQTSCNFDLSCLQGDCPAFATVTVDAERRKAAKRRRRQRSATPAPACPTRQPIVADRRLHGPLLGHRRHRRRHGQPDPRHGRDARRLRRPRPRPDRAVAEGRPGRQRRAPQPRRACRRRTTPTAAGVDCLLAFDLLVAASDTHRSRRRPGAHDRRRVGRRRRRPARWSPTRRPPTRELDALTGRLDEVSRADAQPLRRRRGASPPGCSATRRPPTSCCSASPCRPAPSPCRPDGDRAGHRAQRRRRRSATSPRSAGAGGGSSTPTDGRGAPPASPAPALPETTRRADRAPRRRPRRLPGRRATRERFRDLVDVARARRAAGRPGEHARSPRPSPGTAHKLMAYKDEYEVARLLLRARGAARRTRPSADRARR